MHMVLLVSEAFATLSAWSEGCVCHDDELRGASTSRQQKRMRTQYPQLPHWATCPMRGKRLPEAAAGAWHAHVNSILSTTFTDLAFRYENALSAGEWAAVQTDFASAKAFIYSVLH
eukprot:4939762-Amphidinium_carterae.1